MTQVVIKQIMVEADGKLCVVSLGEAETAMLVPLIGALSDGPIKLVPVPGLTMVPVSEIVTPGTLRMEIERSREDDGDESL